MTTTSTRPAHRAARFGALAAAAGLVLAACSTGAAPAPPADDLLADHGLGGLDAAQIVDRLDATTLDDRPADLIASVQPDALVLSDDGSRETRVPMPDDAFYVAAAPYRAQTHDCHFHSLTTCVGELRGEEVTVTVTDDATGEVLVDETRRTFDNGFVGLWLPRDVDATLTVEHDGDTATADLSTRGTDDPTCLTGLRLT